MRTNDRGRSIRIGIQDHCPPISFVDNHGERTGLCVEIARDFVDRVSAEVQLCVLSWKGLVDALAARQIDVIASDLTPRDPAPTGLRYTSPFFFGEVVTYTRSDTQFKHWSDIDRRDVTIVVAEDTIHAAYAQHHLPHANLAVFGCSGAETARAVATGMADAGMKDRGNALQYPRMFENLRIVDGVVAESPLSFGVRNDDEDLYRRIDEYLAGLRDDPSFHGRLDYWWCSRAWEDDHDWL